jgi:uncharacterized protein with FMN-binding domain
MKKFFLSFAVFVVSAGYVVYQYTGGGSANAAVTTTNNTSTPQTTSVSIYTPTPTQITTQTPIPAPTPTPVTKPKGQYADGTYTGAGADAYYGTVQIQAVIQNGKLVTVNFLQYPNDRSTSRYINAQAMPQLKSEAIAAQSANVSGVSGASDTSAAFIQSLGDALAQAKN